MPTVSTPPQRNSRLEPALAKIARAIEHRDEARSLVTGWQRSDPVQRVTRTDPATRRLQHIADAIAPLPPRLPLVIGDMAHNLRSALDHTAYQLFLANGGSPKSGRHVAFPIEETVRKYRDSSDRKLRGVAPAAKAAIDALHPYKQGGDDRFYQISELDNADKHRLLLVVAAQLRSVAFGAERIVEAFKRALPPGSTLEFPADLFFKVADPKWPLEVGDLLATDVPDAKPDSKTQFVFDVVFGETGVCGGDQLLRKMNELLSFTETTINGLAVHL